MNKSLTMRQNRANINVNDALGNFSLTLIDTLDTLAVLGNGTEFRAALNDIVRHVSFNQNTVVQVFETNIRILGMYIQARNR